MPSTSPENSQPTERYAVATRETIIDQQVDVLLRVLSASRGMLMGAMPFLDPEGEHPELDGGVRAAIEATSIKALDRLDSILTNDVLWDSTGSQELFESMAKNSKLQGEFLAEQIKAAATLNRPSYQLRPVLALIDGGYVAIYGSLDNPGAAIIGRGLTPEAALLDFDLAWKRTPAQQEIIIQDTPVIPPAPTEQPKPRSRRKKPSDENPTDPTV